MRDVIILTTNYLNFSSDHRKRLTQTFNKWVFLSPSLSITIQPSTGKEETSVLDELLGSHVTTNIEDDEDGDDFLTNSIGEWHFFQLCNSVSLALYVCVCVCVFVFV